LGTDFSNLLPTALGGIKDTHGIRQEERTSGRQERLAPRSLEESIAEFLL
jgi:hypothetical protein